MKFGKAKIPEGVAPGQEWATKDGVWYTKLSQFAGHFGESDDSVMFHARDSLANSMHTEHFFKKFPKAERIS